MAFLLVYKTVTVPIYFVLFTFSLELLKGIVLFVCKIVLTYRERKIENTTEIQVGKK